MKDSSSSVVSGAWGLSSAQSSKIASGARGSLSL